MQHARKGSPVPDDDDDVLNIDADDLAEEPLPPAPPSAPPLELSLDDLDTEAPAAAAPTAAPTAAPGYFPALTGEQLTAAANSITIRTLCTSQGRPFLVRYVEDKPGVFVTHEVTPLDDKTDAGTAGGGASGAVKGQFGTSADYACPFCGNRAIIVCGKCGSDICIPEGKFRGITCPGCQAHLNSVSGAATNATGFLGLGKGKK